MEYYLEVCNNLQARKPAWIIPIMELPQLEANTKGLELYRSMYIYDKEILEYKKQNGGSISGFPGTVYPSTILLDIDNKIEDEKETGIENLLIIMNKIEQLNIPEESYHVYFSGTGFHVEIHPSVFGFEPSPDLPKYVKETIMGLFPQVDPIYDKTRVYRVAGTINQKSQLYKTPLTYTDYADLVSTEELKLLCSSKPIIDWSEYLKSIDTPLLSSYIPKSLVFKKAGEAKKNTLVVKERPNKFLCIHDILDKGPVEGERHNTLLRLASHFKRQGYNRNVTYFTLRGWAEDYPEDDLNKIINDVYTWDGFYTCQDPVMKAHCDPSCIFFSDAKILDIESLEESLKHRVEEERTSIDLKDVLNLLYNSFIIESGELVSMQGATGAGKSAFVQNIVARINLPTLYFSFEMPGHQMYRRFLEILTGRSKREVLDNYLELMPMYHDQLKHIKVATKPIEVEQLPRYIELVNPKRKV
jgi:hypothetical protein